MKHIICSEKHYTPRPPPPPPNPLKKPELFNERIMEKLKFISCELCIKVKRKIYDRPTTKKIVNEFTIKNSIK